MISDPRDHGPLADRGPDAPLLVEDGAVTSVAQFLERAARVRATLGAHSAVINLCETRPAFLAAYLAALQARIPTLLPQSRAPEVVDALAQAHPGSCRVSDADVAAACATQEPAGGAASGRVPGDHLAMVGFTSGSTGQPSRHAKRWGSVVASTHCNAAAIRAALPPDRLHALPWIVGTVPSQHMYGMELTVLLPLLAGMGLNAARPLLPVDVATVLAQTPSPRVLVSTPAHLRAIVASGVRLPLVEVTICATAPLDPDLARGVEAATGGVLIEMFGATETCILAHRRTARELEWTAYPGVEFAPDATGTGVSAPWFERPQRLQDVIEPLPGGRFRLVGRNADLVDVAGKRASLADLTRRLMQVPGVEDAVVFQPREARGLVRRLAALVVAPGRTAAEVRRDYAPALDPVFVPRPIVLVASLPRTEAGKLPQSVLEQALASAHARVRPRRG